MGCYVPFLLYFFATSNGLIGFTPVLLRILGSCANPCIYEKLDIHNWIVSVYQFHWKGGFFTKRLQKQRVSPNCKKMEKIISIFRR